MTTENNIWAMLLFFFSLFTAFGNAAGSKESGGDGTGNFLIGTGIYDITGPAGQISFMGYGKSSQTAHGIHMRLRSRAFIMAEYPQTDDLKEEEEAADEMEESHRSLLRWSWKNIQTPKEELPLGETADPEKAVCFVSIDMCMGSDLLNILVLKRLDDLLPQRKSGKRLCHLENLSISGTHTHSAPAGFLQYALFQVTSYGFSKEVMDTLVEGVAQSILRAYNNLERGSIRVASEMLHEANINRSPSSYLLNPQSERDMYPEGDTDKRMLQLKFTADSGKDVGILNWFAVHGTSMNATNQLISGDNKGLASYYVEKTFNGNNTLPGKGPFVAAFASTNLGDVSPNTRGPRCRGSGLPCDVISSTCKVKGELCVASGPGEDMFESTEIIAKKQVGLSMALFHNASDAELEGPISSRHSFIDMSNQYVVLEDGTIVKTCPAALGYSFAAGTTDGIGDFDFKQGTNSSNPFWNLVGSFVSKPSKEQIECQAPKPILLNTGNANKPYPWDPRSVPISIFRIGRLFIVNVPGEFTTMAGRRLRRAVEQEIFTSSNVKDPIITIAGLANTYTHYITTREEYAGQRYEAASTLYGPHTLQAYIQQYERITRDLLVGGPSTSQDPPSDFSRHQMSLQPPVEFDAIGVGRKFGSVAIEVKDKYVAGKESAFVSFRSANPRNNQRIESTFLTVEHLRDEDGLWHTVYVDGDWCTKFAWRGGVTSFGISFAEITWDIPAETEQGLYRICHFGTRKTLIGTSYEGFFRLPDWFLTNSSGSFMVGLLLHAVKVFNGFSDVLYRKLPSLWGWSRYKDFHGCSKSFLVKRDGAKDDDTLDLFDDDTITVQDDDELRASRGDGFHN